MADALSSPTIFLVLLVDQRRLRPTSILSTYIGSTVLAQHAKSSRDLSPMASVHIAMLPSFSSLSLIYQYITFPAVSTRFVRLIIPY